MKIILHIGSDKTGTTAIQSFLSKNRVQLREKGYLYPNLDNTNNHECLVKELLTKEKGPAWQIFNKLIIEPENAHTIIISSEMLCGLKKEYILLLNEWLKGFEITIISYIRSADEYLESGIHQQLKTSNSPKSFLKLYVTVKLIPFFINPVVFKAGLKNIFIAKWKKTTHNSFIIRPYFKAEWHNSDILADFTYHTNIDITTETNSQKKNITPNLEVTYACCKLRNKEAKWLMHDFSEIMTTKFKNEKQYNITSKKKRNFACFLSKIVNKQLGLWKTLDHPSSIHKLPTSSMNLYNLEVKSNQLIATYIIYLKKNANRN